MAEVHSGTDAILETHTDSREYVYFKNFDDANWIKSEKFNKIRECIYGWFGLVGSIDQWHPELQLDLLLFQLF